MINGTYDTDLTGLYLGGVAPKYYGSDYDGIGRINCVLDSIKNILSVPFRTDNDLWDVDNSNGFTTLQVSFLYYIPSSNTTLSRVAIRFQNISKSHDTLYPYFEGYDEWLTASANITVSEPQGDLYFWPNLGIGKTTVGDKFYIDNVEVYWVADSSQGLVHSLLISDLTEDTTYNYDCVAVPQGGNASYSDGEDSTFTTALVAPNLTQISVSGFYELTAYWDANTTRNAYGTAIERDTADGSSWVRIDTIAKGTTYYTDTGLLAGGTYKYRVINLGYNSESDYSGTMRETVTEPGGDLTFVPSSISYYNIDSTGADSTLGLLVINNSGVTVTITDTNNVRPPFTLVLPEALPIVLSDTDTAVCSITLDRDTSGTFTQYANFVTDFGSNLLTVYANVIGFIDDTTGAEGYCGAPYSYDLTVPVLTSVNATQDSVIWIWTHSNPDSLLDVYFMRAPENTSGDVSHVCWDSTDTAGLLRWAMVIDGNFTRGSFYSFKLRAAGEIAVGVTIWSNADTVNIPVATEPDITPPDAVTNFIASGFNVSGIPKTYINMSWAASISGDVNYVKIMKDSGNTYVSGDSIAAVTVGTATLQDTLVGANEIWSYQPIAVDDTGNVSISNPSDSAFVPNAASVPNPNAPVLTAVADTFFVTLTVDTTGCWEAGGGTIDSIKFYESTTLLATQIGLEYIHTGLTYNTAYSYTSYVKDSNGNLSSVSNTKNVTTIDTTTSTAGSWYVDKNAGGGNNGTSWGNAWESFAAIVWTSINPGDFLYISGGADSTIYYEQLFIGDVQGTAADYITIIAGKYSPSPSGHSGRVIIDGMDYPDAGGIQFPIYIGGSTGYTTSYLTLKGFEIRGGQAGIKMEEYGNCITIDSMTIYHWYDLAGVIFLGTGYSTSFDGMDSITVKNCSIISDVDYGSQTDGIYWGGATNTVIHDNFIRMRSQHPLAHVDCLQSIYSQGGLIYNNVLISDSVNSTEGGGMPFIIRSGDMSGDALPIIVYNNFMYMGGIWYAGTPNLGYILNTHYGDNYAGTSPTYIFQNTVVGNGPNLAGTALEYFGVDWDGVFLNNIVTMFGDGDRNRWTFGANAGEIDSIRNNLVWNEYSDPDLFKSNAWTYDWAGWVAAGGTGVNGNPLFVDSFGNESDQGALRGTLQSGSPAINQGEDLQYLYNFILSTYGITIETTDINGVERDSSPEIGAYEYVP